VSLTADYDNCVTNGVNAQLWYTHAVQLECKAKQHKGETNDYRIQ